jgi:outer membrane murein-binding lipoprotein Lpp
VIDQLAHDLAAFLEDATGRPLRVNIVATVFAAVVVGACCAGCGRRWKLDPITGDEAFMAGARTLAADLATLVCDAPCHCSGAVAPARMFR